MLIIRYGFSDSEGVGIELKKGLTSDKVVGQTLRYIGWVKENLAKHRNVSSVIIAKEFDEKTRYSLPINPQIKVKTYDISFKLKDV